MSTTIPLTYRVDHKIGLDAKDLTPVQIEELSAQQAIFSCGCLFYLLRQAARSEPHDPLFNPLLFLHALEQIAEMGEATSLRSRRQHKASGGAQRNPRWAPKNMREPAKRAAAVSTGRPFRRTVYRPLRGL